jgi:hypothetical protein
MTAQNVVYSEGSLHGLPSFPDESNFTNLTALVTGANGISGYHLVRVLVANPKRWSQIYCLSRRPPPDNFFEDLGEGATRVKHIAVDFLSEPAQIADRLKVNIQKMQVRSQFLKTMTPFNRIYTVIMCSSSLICRPSKRAVFWRCGQTLVHWPKSTVCCKK